MATYAEITDGTVTNRVICDDPDHVAQMGWVGPLDGMDPEPQMGWSYDGMTWTPPPPMEIPAQTDAQ